MSIVIDVNTLAMVFSEANARHADFCFVKTWIEKGFGVVVYGGTKYKDELSRAGRYMRLLRLLRDGGRAVTILDDVVDDLEKSIREKTKGTGCDDQHIIALLGASHCSLLCSADARSFEYVKNRNLYPKRVPVVRIYTSARNKKLLRKTDPCKLKNINQAYHC